ncbi:DUF2306 domain-containing protein [Aquimarina algiphila]|uniref:DUF2306 domain-containing protein n=1 Tax=Aquimarina algiphila TaxID=2047982 RepID=UPI003A5C7E06
MSSLLGWFAFRSFIRIMKGNVLKHQQDMIRSYILVVSAINLRILSFVFVSLFTWSGEHMYTTIAILSWLPFLLFYEVYVYFQTKK